MRAPAVEVPRARESYCANCAWSRGGSGTGRVGTVVVPLASWNESNVGRRSSRALLGAVADRLGMMRRGAAAVRGLLLGGSFCACPCPETEYNLGDDGGTYGGSSLRIVGIKRPFLSNMDFTVEVCLCGGTSTCSHVFSSRTRGPSSSSKSHKSNDYFWRDGGMFCMQAVRSALSC